MKVIASGRQTGRTTKLITMCAEMEKEGHVVYIVCHDLNEAHRIVQTAENMGYTGFRFPVTYDEFLTSHGQSLITRYVIDNAELLLQRLTTVSIAAITVTTEEEVAA